MNLDYKHKPATRLNKEFFVGVKPRLEYSSGEYIYEKGGPKYSQERTRGNPNYGTTGHLISRQGSTRRKTDFKLFGDFLKEKSNGRFILQSGKILRVIELGKGKKVKKTSVLTKGDFEELNRILKNNSFVGLPKPDKLSH